MKSLIDFHTHFFPDGFFTAICRWFKEVDWPVLYQQSIEERISYLKEQGVSQVVSLHYPHKSGMAQTLNQFVFDLGQKHADFIIPFGSLHPDDENKTEILQQCFEEFRFKGIKIHSHVQKVGPDDPRMDEIYQVCNQYKKIALIHCGTGPHFNDKPVKGYGYDVTTITGIARFQSAISRFPDIKFVVPHLGYEEVEEFFALLDIYPNLYLDTSMALAGYFPVKLKKEWFVTYADRLLFGTDFPVIPHEWKKEKEILSSFNLGSDIEDKIFFKNAQRLLGL